MKIVYMCNKQIIEVAHRSQVTYPSQNNIGTFNEQQVSNSPLEYENLDSSSEPQPSKIKLLT